MVSPNKGYLSHRSYGLNLIQSFCLQRCIRTRKKLCYEFSKDNFDGQGILSQSDAPEGWWRKEGAGEEGCDELRSSWRVGLWTTLHACRVQQEGTRIREGNSLTLDTAITEVHLTPGLVFFAQGQAACVDRYTRRSIRASLLWNYPLQFKS